MSKRTRALIDAYFEAMRGGRDAEAELLALFTDDAVYVEPFSGESRTHEGKDQIRACLRASWDNTPPDLTLRVNRVDVDGERVSADWTCESPAFDAPVRGRDEYVLRDGRIARLEVRFVSSG